MDVDSDSEVILIDDKTISTAQTTPNTSTTITATDVQRRPVADIIAEEFPPFDHQATIARPYEFETKRDTEFKEREFPFLHYR